jgi:hypothetical protein
MMRTSVAGILPGCLNLSALGGRVLPGPMGAIETYSMRKRSMR